MSPREQAESVQRAIRAEREQREEPEPLSGTLERLEPALRGKAGRLVLFGILTLGGLGTAHETGALAMVLPKDRASEDLKDVKRLVSWLVRQERNRQVRECLAHPTDACRIDEPPDPEASR